MSVLKFRTAIKQGDLNMDMQRRPDPGDDDDKKNRRQRMFGLTDCEKTQRDRINDLNGIITGLRGDVRQRDNTITGLRGDVRQRDNTITGLRGDVRQRDNTITGLKKNLGRILGIIKKAMISRADSSNSSQEDTNGSFQDETDETYILERIGKLQQDTQQKDHTITGLNQQLQEMKEKYARHDEQIKDLSTVLERIKSLNTIIKKRHDEQIKDLSTVLERIKSLNTRMDSSQREENKEFRETLSILYDQAQEIIDQGLEVIDGELKPEQKEEGTQVKPEQKEEGTQVKPEQKEEGTQTVGDLLDKAYLPEAKEKDKEFFDKLPQIIEGDRRTEGNRKLAILLVTHLFPGRDIQFDAISDRARLMGIITKSSSGTVSAKEQFRTMIGPIKSEKAFFGSESGKKLTIIEHEGYLITDLDRKTCNNADIMTEYLNEKLQENEDLIIIDHGGYFASSIKELYKRITRKNDKGSTVPRILGVVENTENGHLRYLAQPQKEELERQKREEEKQKQSSETRFLANLVKKLMSSLWIDRIKDQIGEEPFSKLETNAKEYYPVPIVSVARSEVKDVIVEPAIGASIVNATTSVLRDNSMNIQNMRAAVFGYGRVGINLATMVKGVTGKDVDVVDPDSFREMQADRTGFNAVDAKTALRNADIVFCAANCEIQLDYGIVKKGCIFVTVTSPDDALAMPDPEIYRKTEVRNNLHRYEKKHSDHFFYLLNDGKAGNFTDNKATVPEISAVLAAEIMGCQQVYQVSQALEEKKREEKKSTSGFRSGSPLTSRGRQESSDTREKPEPRDVPRGRQQTSEKEDTSGLQDLSDERQEKIVELWKETYRPEEYRKDLEAQNETLRERNETLEARVRVLEEALKARAEGTIPVVGVE
jgi:S-adenosylhomocysteine hydrolase